MKKLLCFLFVAMFCGTICALNAPTLSNPDDSLVMGDCRIGFQWSVVSDAKYYRLEVDTTKTFDSPVCRVFADLTTTNSYWFTYYVYDLYFKRNYYWRVKAFNADKSEESAWTPIRTFTTPKTVTLRKDDDPNPTGTYYPKQTLFWRSIRGSSGYDIEWDTVPTFNSKVYKKYQCSISQNDEDTQLSYAISNLYFNSMYYWRVRAYNKVDTTVWSETRRFHTLTKMKQSSPDNGATSIRIDPTLYWNSNYMDYGIKKVQVQIDTVPTFDSPFFEQETSTGAGYKFTDVPFLKTIYWRIRGIHTNDTTEWSDTWSFTTFRGASLSSPSDSATGIITWPSLFCNEHNGVRAYHFQLDTAATFDSPLLREQKNSDREFEPKYLNFGTTYYWRVRDCHKRDTSMWTPARCFTTYYRGLCSSPANGTKEVSLKPTLRVRFTTGVSYYQIELDSLPTFDSPGMLDTLVKITDSYYNSCDLKTSLDRGTTYYWRVRDCHQNDTSLWSNVWSFTTASPVATPKLKSPDDATSHACDRVQFIWNKVANVGKYQIEVDTTTLFNSPFRKSTQVNDTTTTLKNMLVGATHYWRVRAYSKADATIHSAWSVPRSFVATKLDPVEKAVQLKFCEGDSAEYRGKWYYDAGQDVINAEGETRDTVITVTISVNKASASAQTKTITFGDDETWNGYDLSVYSVGQYILEYTTSNVAGCDSVVTLTLTVIPQPVNTDLYETACDKFVWEGKTYTTSQDIVTKHTTALGGDSTVTMHLTINYSNTGSETQSAVGSFDWHGQTYTQSGNYQYTLTNAVGCDSVVTLYLTITPVWKVTLVQPEHGTISCQEDIILDYVIDQTVLHFTAFPDENFVLDKWIGCNADGSLVVTKNVSVTCLFIEITPTAINQTANESSTANHKYIKNGKLFIQQGDKTYNAQGARLK